MPSTIVKRSVTINAHRTSISLEDVFWHGLYHLAVHHNKTVPQMLSDLKLRKPKESGLSSAVRVTVVEFALKQAELYKTEAMAHRAPVMIGIETRR